MLNRLKRLIGGWFTSSLGLYIAAGFLSNDITTNSRLEVIVIAGLILAVVNMLLKPILIILSLPAIVFTLGLFMIIINGALVYLVSKLYHPLHITNFWAAIFAGMVIGLVNYLVTTIVESRPTK